MKIERKEKGSEIRSGKEGRKKEEAEKEINFRKSERKKAKRNIEGMQIETS